MLVATPGQTASYSTLHNNSTNGGGSNNTAAATSTTKKPPTLNSTNVTTLSTAKSLNTNNGHAESTVTTKNSLNSNTHSTTLNYHANSKNDNIACNKFSNLTKAITSSRENIPSSKPAATTHSFKSENSTNTINTTTIKQQSFIQTLKDSVQKALISTTGGSSNNNSIVNKYTADNKLKANCNNSTTSINNVTSSSSSTSNNAANKVSTTTSSNTSSNSTAVATQPSSSVSAVRGKHFSYSLSKLHTIAPTVIHRYPEERQHASSTDSLQKEMCHFKPIRVVPKTPWKSGSKSRGNSLRFPKANLATKKIEFVLKSNCDVNNRKKKQQHNATQNNKVNLVAAKGDDNEQENKEFKGIYKPKPSITCLSTSITTPNHQSAFVCLVAQMKNLVTMPSKRELGSIKSSASVVEETSDESIKEIYVKKRQKYVRKQQKEKKPAQELKNVRSTRFSLNISKNKQVANNIANNQATAKKEISKRTNISTAAITKAKSPRKLGPAKSKIINIMTLSAIKAKEKLQNSVSMPAVGATNKIERFATASKNSKKRKPAQDTGDLHQQTLLTTSTSSASTFFKSPTPKSRKSSRLSTKNSSVATSNELFKHPLNQNFQQTAKSQKNLTSLITFSPPMTRSRLKHLTEQGKIVATATATAGIKKRKI